LKQRQLVARKRGYGPDYVAGFIEKRKKDMREYARCHHIPTPFNVWEAKYLAEREEKMEEERARNAAMEEERAEMQVLNDHIGALCASESLEPLLFSLPSFKCNIITLLTCCILYKKGLDAPANMPQMLPVQGTWKTSCMSSKRELVAPLTLQLWWKMRLTSMKTTLRG
jgi:hypothetical protein